MRKEGERNTIRWEKRGGSEKIRPSETGGEEWGPSEKGGQREEEVMVKENGGAWVRGKREREEKAGG